MPTSARMSLNFSDYSRMWASALLSYCPIPPHPNPLPQAPKGEGTAMLVLLKFQRRWFRRPPDHHSPSPLGRGPE